MLTQQTANRKDVNTANKRVELQHRHFSFIAGVIAAMPIHPQLRELHKDICAASFADACARTNPKFDRERFLAACKLTND